MPKRCRPRNELRRIPKQGFNGRPKEAGPGAERLTTPSVQGIYHQSLLGPLQQGWVEEAADGYFIKGSVEETVVQHSDSTGVPNSEALLWERRVQHQHRTRRIRRRTMILSTFP